MNIVDDVVRWYVQNIIVPKVEIINNPGYIFTRFPDTLGLGLRELFLPETLICELEKSGISPEVLYSIGKKFGYMNAHSSKFITVSTEKDEKKFSSFVYFLVKYVEGTWAGGLSHKIDMENKTFQLEMKDYIVCRKNSLGYLLSAGGIAGIWAYMMQDPEVEAVQPKCQGAGNDGCLVIAAPYKSLEKMGFKPTRAKAQETMDLDMEYVRFNKPAPTKWAKHSVRSLIDFGFFEYSRGQVTYKGERFFFCEASFMYLLERELKKVRGGTGKLWDVSFGFGKRLAKISGKQNPCKFIGDLFPAIGFGDVLAVVAKDGEYEVFANYFPWLRWAGEIDFVMFRGMLSGVISGFTNRETELKMVKKDTSLGGLSLYLSN